MLGTGASPNEREPRRATWLIVNLVFVLIIGTCVVGGYLLIRGSEGNNYPDAWDTRIAPFAEIVEDERGLEFDHPIYVDFLSVKEFQKQVSSDEEDLTAEERKEIEQSTGMMRAVGLLEGKVDLFESSNKLAKVGTLGYYSYEDERIRIRGERLTPAVQSTLVHELTHALQDQHFDLGARFKALENDEGAASSSYRAVVEGDARRIESAWAKSLRKKGRAALERSEAAQARRYKSQSSDIPEILQTFIGAPYLFGEATLALAVAEDGDEAVNRLFAKPPTTDEHLLNPWTLEDRELQLTVPKPELADGEKKFDSGTFGATDLAVHAGRARPPDEGSRRRRRLGWRLLRRFRARRSDLRPDELPGRHQAGPHRDGGHPAVLDLRAAQGQGRGSAGRQHAGVRVVRSGHPARPSAATPRRTSWVWPYPAPTSPRPCSTPGRSSPDARRTGWSTRSR